MVQPVQHNHTTKPYDLLVNEAKAVLGPDADSAAIDTVIRAFIDAGVFDIDMDEHGDVWVTTRLEHTQRFADGEV